MQNKRGQVAMEYLATYGWAIFAIFMVLAILVGSGIFNPNRFTAEECTFSPNLPCGSFYLAKVQPNQLKLGFNLTNAMGFPIYVDNVSFKMDNDPVVQLYFPGKSGWTGGYYLGQGYSTDQLSLGPWTPTPPIKVTAEVRRVYLNVTFRNCQDLPRGTAIGQCEYPGTDPNYPWHIISGRMVASVRNT